MLDSSNPPVAPMDMGSATEPLVISSSAVGRKPTPVGVSQTVLKWHQWPQGDPLQAAPSPQAELAMAELVEVIQRLKSPLGGWPRNMPPTPANLTLYVLDEASAVVDALLVDTSVEHGRSTQPPTEDEANPPIASVGARPYTVLADWTPQLLWMIARSSYLVMQLLGGIRVTVASPDADHAEPGAEPETGILRLRAILTSESGQVAAATTPAVTAEQPLSGEPCTDWLVDLATCTIPSPALSGDVAVEWYQAGQTINYQSGMLLDMLRHAIAATTPELTALMQGVGVDWLQPGQAWQSGKLRLTVDLEFISDADLAASQLAQLTELADAASQLAALQQSEAIAPPPVESSPVITSTNLVSTNLVSTDLGSTDLGSTELDAPELDAPELISAESSPIGEPVDLIDPVSPIDPVDSVELNEPESLSAIAADDAPAPDPVTYAAIVQPSSPILTVSIPSDVVPEDDLFGDLAAVEATTVANPVIDAGIDAAIAPDSGLDAITLGDWLADDPIGDADPASGDATPSQPASDETAPPNVSDHGGQSDSEPSQPLTTPEDVAEAVIPPAPRPGLPSGHLRSNLSDLNPDMFLSPDLLMGTDMEVMTALDSLDDEAPQAETPEPASDQPTAISPTTASSSSNHAPVNAFQELMAMLGETPEPVAPVTIDHAIVTAATTTPEPIDSAAEPLTLDYLFTDLPPVQRAEDIPPAPPELFPEIRLTPRVFAPEPQAIAPLGISWDVAVLAAPAADSPDSADPEELNLSALFSSEPEGMDVPTTQVGVAELGDAQMSGATATNSNGRSLPNAPPPNAALSNSERPSDDLFLENLFPELPEATIPPANLEPEADNITADGLFADLPPLDESAAVEILVPLAIRQITTPPTPEPLSVAEPTPAPVAEPFPLDQLPLAQTPSDWLAAEVLLQTAATEQPLDPLDNPLLQVANAPSSPAVSPLINQPLINQPTESPEYPQVNSTADRPEEESLLVSSIPVAVDLAAEPVDAELAELVDATRMDAVTTVTPLVMPPTTADSPMQKGEPTVREAIEVEAMVLPSPIMPPIAAELHLPAVLQLTLASCVGQLHSELQQQRAIAHHLNSLLPEIQATLSMGSRQRSVDQEAAMPHDRLIPLVMTAACTIIDTLEAQSDEDHTLLIPPVIPQLATASSDELLHQLLWHLTRNCYLVTEFIGGIEAEILQPGQGWTGGTLRLLALLQTQNWLPAWQIDLATGEVWEAAPPALMTDAIAHLSHSDLFPNPCSIAHIKQTLLQRLDRLTPGLRSLLHGIPLQNITSPITSSDELAAIGTMITGDVAEMANTDAATSTTTTANTIVPSLQLTLDLTFVADCPEG